jgi:hypothetical protein
MAYQFIDIGIDIVYGYGLTSTNSQRIDTINAKEENVIAAFQLLVEGSSILDRRNYARIKIVGLNDSIHSPFVDVTLPAGKFKRNGRIIPAAGTGFGKNGQKLLNLSDGHPNYGHDDLVAVDVYCAYWVAKGALAGTKNGNQIHWSNGQTETIERLGSFKDLVF